MRDAGYIASALNGGGTGCAANLHCTPVGRNGLGQGQLKMVLNTMHWTGVHWRIIRTRIAAACVATLCTAGLLSGPVNAAPETATATAAKRTAPPSKAEQTLNRGIAAYKRNALARAVGAFSNALSSGGLNTSATARALYYRGLAYRRQGRTALAITDLTNSLWLKNGLTETERADAISNRAAAYKTAGIADPGAPDAPAAQPPAPAASVATAPVAPPTLTAMPKASRPTTTAAIAPPAAPAPGASTSSGSPLSGIGNFFGNLFSGGSQQAAAPAPAPSASDVTTASTGTTAATSSWNSSTQVDADRAAAKSKPRPPQRTAALQPRTVKLDAAPPTAAPLKGKYKLQLAAVRSRAEAEKLAQRFAVQHGAEAGGRTPAIEEAVFGNMGTFYRVNIGPYASSAEPDKLCKSVRGAGFDCLVVAH